ncbi:hypothetical protein GCK72_022690 [Caenorhabditis remanei]|uniref:RING-type domain-containing protein n=1 Tax=Caenorhabditis remanei TaxID=31234 RepID=A0A6A5FUG5_CAERE|nr:hypothetical protein GCK72_022690 [Caenorhabditis remanei]KAF1746237.1 hypothetical protein GCK72_022690 [Caenorhabditis remanei]
MSSLANDFEKVLRAFIPKELIPATWKFDEKKRRVENIQSLMKCGQLGIVKSAEQLNRDIGSYMGFPGSTQHFEIDSVVAPSPDDYTSLKNTMYIYKRDLFLLFDFKDISSLRECQREEVEWVLNDCLQQMDFGSHHEMIVKPDIKTIIKDGEEILKNVMPFLELSKDCEKIYEDSKKRFLETLHVDIRETVSDCLEGIIVDHSTEKYHFELLLIINWIGFIMKGIENFVKKESINLPPLNSASLTKPIIRLFSIDKNHFVMADELLKTLKKCNMDVSGFEEEVFGMKELSTFTFREVSQKVDKDVMKNLEFVKMDDFRLIFAQTPIPTCDGGYCNLAVDVLRDVLMDIIVAKKVFQTTKEKNWIHIKKFFKSVEKYFDRTRGVYFIDLKNVKTIKELWENEYNSHLKHSLSSSKLMTTSKKNLAVDLAVVQCQINSLVRKVPMLLEFIHKQGACDRLSIVGCELCDGKTLTEDSAQPQGSEKSEDALQKKMKPQSSKDTQSEPEKLNSEEAKSDVTTKKKPEPKESNACPKCERAGKFTREANQKLRISKIEVKQLKKDLIRNQLENEEIKQKVMDKDERIRMLERLLEEKDDVIKEQEEKMREQATIIQGFQTIEKEEDTQTVFDEKIKKIKSAQSNLLAIKKTLEVENPVFKCAEVMHRFIMNTENEETKQMAKMEMRRFEKEATEYTEAVEDRLAMIQCNQFDAAEEIPELPEFPVFSQKFRSIYKNIMKSKPPVICQQLLSSSENASDELEDTECVICLNNMNLEDETTKCGYCKRRYHNGCIQDWLKVKMICPTCDSGLLDEEEFPVLV